MQRSVYDHNYHLMSPASLMYSFPRLAVLIMWVILKVLWLCRLSVTENTTLVFACIWIFETATSLISYIAWRAPAKTMTESIVDEDKQNNANHTKAYGKLY